MTRGAEPRALVGEGAGTVAAPQSAVGEQALVSVHAEQRGVMVRRQAKQGLVDAGPLIEQSIDLRRILVARGVPHAYQPIATAAEVVDDASGLRMCRGQRDEVCVRAFVPRTGGGKRVRVLVDVADQDEILGQLAPDLRPRVERSCRLARCQAPPTQLHRRAQVPDVACHVPATAQEVGVDAEDVRVVRERRHDRRHLRQQRVETLATNSHGPGEPIHAIDRRRQHRVDDAERPAGLRVAMGRGTQCDHHQRAETQRGGGKRGAPTQEATKAIDDSAIPSENRLVAQVPAQVGGELARRGVALFGRSRRRLAQDVVRIPAQAAVVAARRPRHFGRDPDHRLAERFAAHVDRQVSGEHLVGDDAERVHIAAHIPGTAVAQHPLRRAVRQRAGEPGRFLADVACVRHAEVEKLRARLRIGLDDEDVLGLEIAMQHATLVRMIEGVGDAREQRQPVPPRGPAVKHVREQRHPVGDEFHGEERNRARSGLRDADLVHLHDARMVEAGLRRDLDGETPLHRPSVGTGDDLERHFPRRPLLPGAIHDAVRAAPEQAEDLEARQPSAYRERRGDVRSRPRWQLVGQPRSVESLQTLDLRPQVEVASAELVETRRPVPVAGGDQVLEDLQGTSTGNRHREAATDRPPRPMVAGIVSVTVILEARAATSMRNQGAGGCGGCGPRG